MAYANVGTVSASAQRRITEHVVRPVVSESFQETMMKNRQAAVAASPDGLILAGTFSGLIFVRA